ncbi:translocation/assembly module TamB domain-containing protein [Candidatus Aminicenantes bacterium AH-873-B07]|nr:translocation/assembly module TamB domain-containing protein [Candidatus Aminicenantes bacterium AH-873-B07]
MEKRIKLLISFVLILIFISGSIFFIKYFFLHQIKSQIGKSLKYSSISLNVFPPQLIIHRPSTSKNGIYFSAEKLIINFLLQSLLKEKQIEIFIEKPLIKFSPNKVSRAGGKGFFLPLTIKRGIIYKGKIQFENNEMNISSLETNIFFTQRGDNFFIIFKANKYLFSLPNKKINLNGKINLIADIKGRKIEIKKLKFFGKDFWFNINGEIENISSPVLRFETFYRLDASIIKNFLSLPFSIKGGIEGSGILKKEKYISYKGKIFWNNLIFENSEIGKTFGTINFSSLKGTKLDLWFDNKKSFLALKILSNYIKGEFKNFNLKPILNWLSLGWPVKSPSWGNFEIKNKRLRAHFEFKDESFLFVNNKFPLNGKLDLEWNGKRLIRLSSSKLISSFGSFSLSGVLIIGDKMDIEINAKIKNIEQTNNFINSLLNQSIDLSQIEGKGNMNIKIYGNYSKPKISSFFNFHNVKIYDFDFSEVEGEIIYKNELLGEAIIRDNHFKGIVTINITKEKTFLNINLENGNINKIISDLKLSLPINGKISGKIFIIKENEKLSCEIAFYSNYLEIFKKQIRNIQGIFRWSNQEISFPSFKFNFNGGNILGELYFSPLTKEVNLNILGKDIDISPFSIFLKGKLSFSIKGNSKVENGMILGNFTLNDFSYFSYPKRKIKGRIILGEVEKNITLELTGKIEPGENRFLAQYIYPLNSRIIKGKTEFEFKDLRLILPWKGTKGEINSKIEVSGPLKYPKIKAIIDFKGKELPIPKFAHSFKNFSGLILFEKNKLQLLSFTAEFGGGKVNGFGGLKLKNWKSINNLNFHFYGENMLLSPFERTRFLCDSKLNLIKNAENFILKGEIFVHRMLWRRNLGEKIAFSSSPFLKNESDNKLFKNLTLDLYIRSEKDSWINNSFGTIESKFNLKIFGNINSPNISGEIIALRGKLFFQDRIFNLIEGKINFIDPLNPNNPEIHFKAETFVKDYRVLFSLNGPVNHLKPELTSSPPLPPDEILALLALGEAFKRTYSYDKSTQLSISSLLSFKLTEGITSKASKIFGIDWFKINPFLMGSVSQTTPRLSLGKKIAKDIIILYSTNLSTHRNDYLFLEWKFTKDISIIAIRDEEGRIGLDVKFHKRF